jgi:hypothetical protein
MKVPNAKGCQDASCNRVHYDLGTMKREAAKSLIKDCAGTHQMGKLLEAAEGPVKRLELRWRQATRDSCCDDASVYQLLVINL